jgi:hypothetical protein
MRNEEAITREPPVDEYVSGHFGLAPNRSTGRQNHRPLGAHEVRRIKERTLPSAAPGGLISVADPASSGQLNGELGKSTHRRHR